MLRAFLRNTELIAGDVIVARAPGHLAQLGQGGGVLLLLDERDAQIAAGQQIARVRYEDGAKDGDRGIVPLLNHAVQGVFVAQEFGQAIFGIGGWGGSAAPCGPGAM